MEDKIKAYCEAHGLGKVKKFLPLGPWAKGEKYIVKTNRKLGLNVFTVFEEDEEVKTVRNQKTQKAF